VEAAIAAFVLATLSYRLQWTEGCSLPDKAAWVALELLRPVILAAWQAMSAYLCDSSGFLPQVLQIMASIGPPLGDVVGLV
jgi:hypothetical protein